MKPNLQSEIKQVCMLGVVAENVGESGWSFEQSIPFKPASTLLIDVIVTPVSIANLITAISFTHGELKQEHNIVHHNLFWL